MKKHSHIIFLIQLSLMSLCCADSTLNNSYLPKRFRFCTTAHGRFIASVNDQHIGWVLSQGRHWEEELVQYGLEVIRPGSVVIDIGANMGTHTIPWASKAGRVYAFEPQRLIFQQLCANLILNDIQNVYPIHAALGHNNGAAHLDAIIPAVAGFSPERPLTYQLTDYPINYGGARLGSGGEEVEMCTLDSYHLSNVSLIKVDVEGAEPLVFYGAQETIRANRPVIIYEKREDRKITSQMIQTLKLESTITDFEIEDFIAKEIPDGYESPKDFGSCGDRILIPKQKGSVK